MFKKEEKLIVLLSSIIITGVIISVGKEFGYFSYLYLLVTPLYLSVVCCCYNLCESRERVDDAVSYCLDESDFNVIDKIEQLRLYFKDTRDVIDYLSTVDPKVLTFAFDERNTDLNYKEYIIGAVRCLSMFKKYTGSCYFNIDSVDLPENERVTTLLSTLYLVSKQIDSRCNYIYITSKKCKGKVVIDVIDQHHNSTNNDQFCEKLFDLFSSKDLVLSHRAL